MCQRRSTGASVHWFILALPPDQCAAVGCTRGGRVESSGMQLNGSQRRDRIERIRMMTTRDLPAGGAAMHSRVATASAVAWQGVVTNRCCGIDRAAAHWAELSVDQPVRTASPRCSAVPVHCIAVAFCVACLPVEMSSTGSSRCGAGQHGCRESADRSSPGRRSSEQRAASSERPNPGGGWLCVCWECVSADANPVVAAQQ